MQEGKGYQTDYVCSRCFVYIKIYFPVSGKNDICEDVKKHYEYMKNIIEQVALLTSAACSI